MKLNIDWNKIFNSCVIVVPVDPVTADAIYLNEGEDKEELHVTLLFFPGGGDMEKLHRACEKVAASFSPFIARSTGVGSFDTGDQKTIHLDMIREPLAELREALMAEVEGYSTKFPDFKPHITLAYVDKETPLPEHEAVTLKVDRIEIWNSGGFRFSYSFKSI